jgi:hypothetical protein
MVLQVESSVLAVTCQHEASSHLTAAVDIGGQRQLLVWMKAVWDIN